MVDYVMNQVYEAVRLEVRTAVMKNDTKVLLTPLSELEERMGITEERNDLGNYPID